MPRTPEDGPDTALYVKTDVELSETGATDGGGSGSEPTQKKDMWKKTWRCHVDGWRLTCIGMVTDTVTEYWEAPKKKVGTKTQIATKKDLKTKSWSTRSGPWTLIAIGNDGIRITEYWSDSTQ